MHRSRLVYDTGDLEQLGADRQTGTFCGFTGDDDADSIVFNDKLHGSTPIKESISVPH